MTQKNKILTFLGWYGAFAILTAYILLSFRVLDVESLWYILLNLTGSLGIVMEALNKKDYPPTLLNLVWFLVGTISLIRLLT